MSPEDSFTELTNFLNRFDALELLCQASLTFLYAKEGEFHSESDEIQIWARHIEFAAGYYATQEDEGCPKETVTGWTLEAFKKLMDQYYLAVDIAEMARGREQNPGPFAIFSARIHSMHVRGEAYPHQFEIYARGLYGSHDDWFLENLGFTISDAFAIADAFIRELNDRHMGIKASTNEEARALVENDSSWAETGMTKDEARSSAWCQLFFGQAKEHCRFSLEQIVAASQVPRDRCVAALKRLSQKPPFRSSFFPETFADGRKAPWDYNTLAERPLFTDGSDYWLLVSFLFKQSLYYSFFFDLMGDQTYKPTFESKRGVYLEEKTAEYLRNVFPASAVLLNPAYPNGEEFADVLVLYDGRIIIVQCKGKTLTRPAFIGADCEAIRSDVQKAVKSAIDQGVKGRKFLESYKQASLVYNGVMLEIDMTAVTRIEIIAVTFLPLHTMATRIKEVEADLGLPIVNTQLGQSPSEILRLLLRFVHLLRDSSNTFSGASYWSKGIYGSTAMRWTF